MNRVKLGDICTIYDGPHATPKKTTNGPVYLGIDAITPDGKLDESAFAHLNEDDYEKWTKRVVPEYRDIVFSYEATLGRYAMIPKDFHGCLGRRLGIFRANQEKVVPEWLYYFLRSPMWTRFMENHTYRGSTVNRYSVEDMPEYLVPLPSMEEQRDIANVLCALDAKIDNNKKLMAELDATARLVYDYWFTQFDFPDENGRPYRSAGGKMVLSDVLKREIPVGWTAGCLGDIASYSDTNISNGLLSSSTYVSTDNMEKNLGGLLPSNYVPSDGTSVRFDAYDTLLSNIRPYFKKAYFPMFTGGCCNDVLVLHPSKPSASIYLFLTISQDLFFEYDSKGAKGSKMPRGDKEHILAFPIAIPPEKILQQFSSRLKPTVKFLDELQRENQEILTLRNWLLPLLMNGQAQLWD